MVDIAAGVLIALGTYNFATAAKFPMSGFNGIGLIFYHLWGLPIGIVALILNIPVAIACYKTLGRHFMLRFIRSTLITSLIMDYVAPLMDRPSTTCPEEGKRKRRLMHRQNILTI